MESTAIGSGMGSSGLIGQLEAIESMESDGYFSATVILPILLVHFGLPACIALLVTSVLKKIK